MKTFKNLIKLLMILSLSMTVSCDRILEQITGEETEENQPTGTSSNPYGNWQRIEGANTWVKFEGSTATTCNNGVVTVGTFNSSEPSMTYNIEGTILKFPLKFNSDNTLLVGVPNQGLETHTASLYKRSDTFCTAGGGNGDGGTGGDGGGGGNGGNGTGKAMFWTQSDIGCGVITVSINGSNGSISKYYTVSNGPDCGADGCANFTLPAGNYSFTATCSQYTWSGTITVTENGCSKMQLYK